MSNPTTVRSKNLNIRIRPEEREFFTWAATSQNQNLSEFVLEAVRRKSEEILLDVTRFDLGQDRYRAFLRALEAPIQPNPALRKVLRRKPLWQK